jgi:uncharacterized protein (TIRG00374 family)
MKGKLLVFLSVLIGIILFVVVTASVNTSTVMDTLKLISIDKFIILFVFYLIVYIISLARWGITISAFGEYVPFLKLISFRFTEWAFCYLTPLSRLGGEPVMAYLMKKEGKLKYRKGISVIVINKVFDFASALVLAFIGLALLLIMYWDILTGRTITLLIGGVFGLALLIYLFYVKTLKKQGFFTMIIKPFKDMIHKKFHDNIKLVEVHLIEFFKANKKKLIVIGIISLMYQILMLVEYKIIGLFLGINLTLVHLLIINLFLILAFMTPTPGSLGGMEGALAFAFSVLSFGGSKGFAFSLTLRAVEIAMTVIGLGIAYYYGLRSFKKLVEEKF